MILDQKDALSRKNKSPFRDSFPRHSRPFSFNPKNRVYITTDEVSDFFFVAEFVAKNVIFVTAATNRSCNRLIIKYAYRVQKLPWKVHDILHREIAETRSNA